MHRRNRSRKTIKLVSDTTENQKSWVFLKFHQNFTIPQKIMNMIILVLVVQFMVFLNVKAQENEYAKDAVNNFEPSLAVVIGILSIIFSLTFFLLLYAKFCRRSAASSSVHNNTNLQIQDGLVRSRSRFSGIDKTVVESLPFFRFSSLKGLRDGLECSVCLSRFEDIEILRLLPKCKHAFHIGCIDQWLENHSTCPLCRYKISSEDLSTLQYSNSLRFLGNYQSELRIHREESSRFSSILSSFRNSAEKNRVLCKKTECSVKKQSDLHRLNHRINIVSDNVVFKNRWSNLTSSDLMFLSSEMIHDLSSTRFSSLDRNTDQMMNIKEEIERKRLIESKIKKNINNDSSFPSSSESRMDSKETSRLQSQNEKRSMSEIVTHPRFTDFNLKNREEFSENHKNVEEERRRKMWVPIARRTVEWFSSRERRSNHQSLITSQSLNV